MYYIVGYTFTVGQFTQPTHQHSSSLLQQQESRRIQKPDAKSPFALGSTYKLIYIKPIVNEKKLKEFEYQFIESKTGKIIKLVFDNSVSADSYIARVSCKTEEYKQAKAQAEATINDL